MLAGFYPAGDYSSRGGTAKAFVNASSSALASAMKDKIGSLKSCKFDLQGGVAVRPGSENQGTVFVNETEVPAGLWRMNSPSELELLGTACETWKQPAVTDFHAGFPCDALIIEL